MGELESALLILPVENFYRHSWKGNKILLGLFHHLCCEETLGISLYIYTNGVAEKKKKVLLTVLNGVEINKVK